MRSRKGLAVRALAQPPGGNIAWNGSELIGTFYQALDGQWVAQPFSRKDRPRYGTAFQAQLYLIAAAGLLVADAA
ncbi:hypothetical protein ACE1AT_13220 [Pelatocladus sp. BLCC-F211]|uniref:hypothetical protein n=1 Tax=Pelatocladus sp. BLCC-F211 TaxID=3342752 RepID=UPI0035B74471